jgi:hypothetical protein
VVVDWPNPPAQLVTVGTTRSAAGPCRPCPPRARSIGNWRSLTDNNGRQHAALTCVIGVASGRNAGTGRAFQARDVGSIPNTRSILPPSSAPLSAALPRRRATGRASARLRLRLALSCSVTMEVVECSGESGPALGSDISSEHEEGLHSRSRL